MRGIISWGAYLPYRRLDRSQISAFVGQGGGKGTRTVAGFDEDTTTMGVEAARRALKATGVAPDTLLFATVLPAYADKTNATAIHAALRLPAAVPAFDLGSAVRSAVGGLHLALSGSGSTLVVASDIRGGLAGSAEEAQGGDAAAAILIGDGNDVVAEFLGGASVTDEFTERWRAPGEQRSKTWDEKFSEVSYLPAGTRAWTEAIGKAGLAAGDVSAAAVAAPTARLAKTMAGKLGGVRVIDDLAESVGGTGAAQPGLLLAALLEQAAPGDVLALVVLADGADVLLFRASPVLATFTPTATVGGQAAAGAPVPYGKYLSWRGSLVIEPPRRPEPQRVSSSAAARSERWKYGFVGSRDTNTGLVHLPPARVSQDGSRTDEMEPAPMADVLGTVATFTVDRVAYSPSPPVVFAIVDFDGGGRLPLELTDVDAADVAIGTRVEMTFRRLFTADGIHNYFWKAKPVRGHTPAEHEGRG